MTKNNVTNAELARSVNNSESSSQINQNIDLLMMLNFMQNLMNRESQILEEKKRAQEHRNLRKPKGISKSQLRKRSNDRAAGAELKKFPPKINRALLQVENETEFEAKNITKLSLECEQLINKFDLNNEDKELLLNLTKAMIENFSDDDLSKIYYNLLDLNEPGEPYTKPSQYLSAKIVAKNTGIKLEDAEKLLNEIYDKLGADFITKCVSSKPADDNREINTGIAAASFVGAGIVCICLSVMLYGIKKYRERLIQFNEIKDNFLYGQLNEYMAEGNIEDACNFILKSGNPHMLYKEPAIITAAIRELRIDFQQPRDLFFARMNEMVENDNRINEAEKTKILEALIIGKRQLISIETITNALDQMFSNLTTLVADNIGSFLNSKDKANVLSVRNFNRRNDDPCLSSGSISEENDCLLGEYKDEKRKGEEYKSEIKINIDIPSQQPTEAKAERLGKTVEMMKLHL